MSTRWNYLLIGALAMAVCTLALTGCMTPEEIAARHVQYMDSVRVRCAEYGYQPGSDSMAYCVQQTVESDRYRQDMAMYMAQEENEVFLEHGGFYGW
jgi:hypothetical protein